MNRESLIIPYLAGIGLFLSTFDSGMIYVLLPKIQTIFNLDAYAISWCVTSFVLCISTFILVFGKLSNQLSCITIYRFGLLLSLIGLLLISCTKNYSLFVIVRCIQGIGAGAIQAVAVALVALYVPKEQRAKAFSIVGLMTALGPLVGAGLTGFIIQYTFWRYAFCLPIILGSMGFLFSFTIKTKIKWNSYYFNKVSLLLFALSAFLVLFAITHWSYHQNISLLSLSTAAIFLFALFLIERKSQHNIINYEYLKNSLFLFPLLGTIALGAVTAIIFAVPPYYVLYILHSNMGLVGILNIFAPLGMVLAAKTSVYFTRNTAAQTIMFIGLAIMLTNTVLLTALPNINLVNFMLVLFCYGIGAGLFQTSSMLAIANLVKPEEQSSINAFIRMLQNVAIAFGIAIASAYLFDLKNENSQITYLWMIASIIIFAALSQYKYNKKECLETHHSQ